MLKHKPDFRNIRRSFAPVFCIFILIGLAGSVVGTIYTTYFAGDYNILNGKHLSGNIPSSVTSVDHEYFIVESVGASTSISIYNPTAYAPIGSTSLILGSVADLASNDGLSMDFRSGSSSTDIKNYVDNNTSDVDLVSDHGTHSDFTAQQYSPDLIYDSLTEQDAGASGLIIRPNGVGKESDWYPVGSTSNWECVDDSTADEDTTFVNITAKSKKDFYSLQNHTTENGTISNVRLQVRAKGNPGAELDLGLVTDLVECQGQTYTLTTSYANYYDDWAVNPATLADWTWSDIDSLEAGFISSKSTDVEHMVTRLCINVTYGPSYELDLEVQWTSVNYDETNEYLCIYGGPMGVENIRVDVWNGSGWENLFTDLNSGWKNVSVSTYLHSSTFTIRFKGSTETNDTTQETWNIDATILHTWTDQYEAEVEFAGSSDTHSWRQLNWTIVTAWTTDSVNVTAQLYNYTLENYLTSGNGYITYKSSSEPSTAETKHQSIISNPEDFRNNTGGWKIRIAGAKSTDTEFDLKIDLIELRPTYNGSMVSTEFFFSSMTTNVPTHLNFTIVNQFTVSNVHVTIRIWNYSSFTYPASGEGSLTYTALGSNETKALNISTDPQFSTSNGNAKIEITGALATPTPFRLELNQMQLLYGHEGQDSLANPFDWFLTLLYVSPLVFVPLFLIVMKLKRKKTAESYTGRMTGTFSEAFGMTHKQMTGKKMLLEIDPTSDFHQALSSFVSEAKNSKEVLFILTNRNSTLHSTFSSDANTKFLLLTSKTSSPQQINKKETLLPATDLSVLLDAFARTQKAESKKTVSVLFDNLSDVILRCGFEKTYKFTRFLLEAISSPKTTALFLFNPTAHEPVVSSSVRGLFQIHLAFTKRGPHTRT
jgi:hypothetical protein